MKKINLAWTRDFTLAWAEWWSTCLNPGLIEIFGSGIDSQLSYFNGRLLETYRLEDESKKFLEGIIGLALTDAFWSAEKMEHYKALVREIRALLAEATHKNIFLDNALFRKIKSLSTEMYPWYTVSYLLPQGEWAEKFSLKRPNEAKEILGRLIEARTHSEGAIGELVEYWRKVVETLFAPRGIPSKYRSFVMFREMERMFAEELYAPNPKELEARSAGYIFFRGRVYTGVSLADFFQKHGFLYERQAADADIREFKGIVASKGVSSIRARVQIVLRNEEVGNFKQGNILVTVMTNPYFVGAMKKAAAVVTEEGGVTCHAAIASRELGIPCIIGTKIATKVLRDGMMIEVDANTGGVVKICNNKSDLRPQV